MIYLPWKIKERSRIWENYIQDITEQRYLDEKVFKKINTTLFHIKKTNGLEMEYTFLKKI